MVTDPELTLSLRRVLDRIAARPGSKLPSQNVVSKVGIKLTAPPNERVISEWIGPCLLRYVDSGERRYMVVLKIRYWPESTASYDIVDAECSCRAQTICWHLLVVLVGEERTGHYLET